MSAVLPVVNASVTVCAVNGNAVNASAVNVVSVATAVQSGETQFLCLSKLYLSFSGSQLLPLFSIH